MLCVRKLLVLRYKDIVQNLVQLPERSRKVSFLVAGSLSISQFEFIRYYWFFREYGIAVDNVFP